MLQYVNFDNLNTVISRVLSRISQHVGKTDNPHKVTKTQVGLGNVDNTSDLNKPISNAVQTSLNQINDSLDLIMNGVDMNGGNASAAQIEYEKDFNGGGA